jgi:hypothetical protein
MDFIKAKDLKDVAKIIKDLQDDVMNSTINGYTQTQQTHPLKIDARLVSEIKKNLTDAGYEVVLTQGKDIEGSPYMLMKLIWS